MTEKYVYTTGELASLLHIHQTTVIDWAKKGLIKSYRTPGGHRRVERASVIDFLKRHEMPMPAELEPKDQPGPKAAESKYRHPIKAS